MPYHSAKALACQGIRQALEEPDELETLFSAKVFAPQKLLPRKSGFGDWLYRVYSIIPDEIGRKVVTYIAKFNYVKKDK